MTHSFVVDLLSRVEGEGGLKVVVQDGSVEEVALNIFEPPRFFEAFLVGRAYQEVPDITARICGICPVAYQMTACAAIEDALRSAGGDAAELAPAYEVRQLRRLLYCGEWLQSHALHVYFLHAPDFLGCNDAVALAGTDPAALQRGVALKKTGNLVMKTVGARAIHPVNVRVGGFYRAPGAEAIRALAGPLQDALEASLKTLEWVSRFDFPSLENDYLFVALRGEGCYPIDSGPVASSAGHEWSPAEFAEAAVEEHVARSTALHARLFGRSPYLTGPLARYALNSSSLSPLAKAAARDAGLGPVCRNPFQSIVVRAVEMVVACEEALRIVSSYTAPAEPAAPLPSAAPGQVLVGTGATEAPRGLLLHRYEIKDGLVTKARIMPPTSQNQLSIEADLRAVVGAGLHLAHDELTHRAEMAVRNHDPCISCAAHFLDIEVQHR
ncbi:MAG TPA: nickel-dependent hydrogenase large subunit [Acidimicrobiales bacterium]|nr:nickel-dependent hydrogenase large subunit [Acidimicrobiales bacterium]